MSMLEHYSDCCGQGNKGSQQKTDSNGAKNGWSQLFAIGTTLIKFLVREIKGRFGKWARIL